MNPAAALPIWEAQPFAGGDPGRLPAAATGREWRPLRQAWLGAATPDGINPGWARIRWSREELCFDAILTGRGARNGANRLNQRTWELGDICEVFLQVPAAATYLELHVTPENHRLQLSWPEDGLERFRSGADPLEAFTIADPAWVTSTTEVTSEGWCARLRVPAAVLGQPSLSPGQSFRAAVCRYDCSGGPAPGPVPRLSSTAPLTAPSYHRRHEWEVLVLA